MNDFFPGFQTPFELYMWSGALVPLVVFLFTRKKSKLLLESVVLGVSIGFFSVMGGYAAFFYWLLLFGFYIVYVSRKKVRLRIKLICAFLNIIVSIFSYLFFWQSIILFH